jgi:hypothetical protein
MAQQLQQKKEVPVMVESDKKQHLEAIKNLSIETLAILAEKSKKPGIEQKLKQFKNFI